MNIAYFYTKFKRKFASPRQVRPYWPSNGKQSTVSRNWTHSLSQMSATLNIFENPTKYQHIQNKYGPQIPRARFSYAVFTSPSVCARERVTTFTSQFIFITNLISISPRTGICRDSPTWLRSKFSFSTSKLFAPPVRRLSTFGIGFGTCCMELFTRSMMLLSQICKPMNAKQSHTAYANK